MKSHALLLALGASLLSASAHAGEPASVTRIETRPFYGATVTIEEGVRVFRALPPHKHIVINPGGKANVSLNFEEQRNKTYNYNYDKSSSSGDNGNAGNGSPVYGGFAPGDGSAAAPARDQGGVLLPRARGHHGGHAPRGRH